MPRKIEELCFPDVSSGPVDCTDSAQCYSLVITNELGERTFGYCRRVLPEGSTQCLPIAYCLLSKRRAPGFYKRVLEELESRHGFPDRVRNAILHELYGCRFPQPGEAVAIDCSRFLAVDGCDSRLNESDVSNDSDICCDSDCNNRNGYPGRETGGVVYVSNNGEYGTLYKKGRKSNLELRLNQDSNNKYIRELSAFVNSKF